MQQSSQALKQGSQLKTVSLGLSFVHGVAINCKLLPCVATILWAGVQQKAETLGDLLPTQEEQPGSTLQESIKSVHLKLSHKSEIKILGQRLAEHKVHTESKETRVINCSFEGSLMSRGCKISARRLKCRAAQFSSHPSVLKDFRELTLNWDPWEKRHIYTSSKTPENQDPLPEDKQEQLSSTKFTNERKQQSFM